MQQHPIPQNITGFEFKLIGFMTLRQFGYLAAAAIIDFILYSAKLPAIIIVSIGAPITLFGLALAFLPVNGFPFERWLAAFLKTIYSPNTRVWHREPKTIGFLEPQFSVYLRQQSQHIEPKILSDRSKLERYLASHKKGGGKKLVDINEDRRLQQLAFPPLASEGQVFTAQNLSPKAAVAQEPPDLAPPRFRRMEDMAR
jgi:hypothetical protein